MRRRWAPNGDRHVTSTAPLSVTSTRTVRMVLAQALTAVPNSQKTNRIAQVVGAEYPGGGPSRSMTQVMRQRNDIQIAMKTQIAQAMRLRNVARATLRVRG